MRKGWIELGKTRSKDKVLGKKIIAAHFPNLVEKKITLGKIKIRYTEFDDRIIMFVDFGRWKKNKDTDTWTIYNAITENHKSYDDVWLDIQGDIATGVEIHLLDRRGVKNGKKRAIKSKRSSNVVKTR